MKRTISYFILLITLTSILAGCFYDEVAVIQGLPENVSLKNDVMPIFNQNCNTSGCHDQAAAHDPSLVSDKVYDALIFGKYVNTLQPEKSSLYLQIVNGTMPPSGELSSNEQKIILGWITEGAKNN
jgi:hypothetical protein